MPDLRPSIERLRLLRLAGLAPDRIVRVLNDQRRLRERPWTVERIERVLRRHPIPSPPPEPVWTFADQTQVARRGHITGAGPLAERLRADLLRLATGSVSVQVRPHPGGGDPLDLNDALLVCLWAKQAAHELKLECTSGPDLKPEPLNYTPVPGRVY